jgi:four helix bundle protein
MGKLEVTTEPEDLRPRTQRFAVSILELVDRLPQTRQGQIVAHQLGRAGTSVGANYRAARCCD